VRKQADEAIRRLEERFSKSFFQQPAAIDDYTFDGERCLDVNRQFLNAFGCQAQDVIDRPLAELQILADEQRWTTVREPTPEIEVGAY